MNTQLFHNLLPINNQNPSLFNENYNHNPYFQNQNNNDGFDFQQNLKNQHSPSSFLSQQHQENHFFLNNPNNGNNGSQLNQGLKIENPDQKQIFNAKSLSYSENFNPRSYIKNTYINKINNLMSGSLNEFKVSEEKKFAY